MHSGFWVKKPQGKKRLGRTRCRWDSDSRVDVKSSRMGSRGLDSHSSGLGQVTDCYEYCNGKRAP